MSDDVPDCCSGDVPSELIREVQIVGVEELNRLGELLECDPDIGSLCAAAIHRNRERDRMLRTISELRGTCGTDIVELRGSRGD